MAHEFAATALPALAGVAPYKRNTGCCVAGASLGRKNYLARESGRAPDRSVGRQRLVGSRRWPPISWHLLERQKSQRNCAAYRNHPIRTRDFHSLGLVMIKHFSYHSHAEVRTLIGTMQFPRCAPPPEGVAQNARNAEIPGTQQKVPRGARDDSVFGGMTAIPGEAAP